MRACHVFAAAVLSASVAANAVVIYATNGLQRPLDGPDSLIAFDSNDPTNWWTVGSMGVPNIGFGGLDFDRDGNLWAYASFFKHTGGAAAGLYRVDLSTGQATLQGPRPANQSLQDMAYNPIDGLMYGINSQNNVSRLYTINLANGVVSTVGVLTGMPASQHVMSLAIDSRGNFYIHEMNGDKIYKGAGLALSELYQLPQDTNFSQGMTIDWSRDDRGYHGAVGYGDYPFYFSQLNQFAADGSGYVLGPEFGPALGDDLPPVEAGDLAIMPIPGPGALAVLGVGLLGCRRRR